ncbi:MAG: hypothetical protein J6V80_00220 [Clostridia bacterium]|nr:hypothetical protein [Clostridia bacterium]
MKQATAGNVIIKEERICDGYSYTYELIHREGVRTDDFRLPLYSMRVSMTDSQGCTSQREARDIFTDKHKAEKLFYRLVENLATPIDLGYVIEDEVRN